MSRTFPRSCCGVSYAIKNQLVASKAPIQSPQKASTLAGSLGHKGAYHRTFPCMEANYPYAIKNQRGASKPLVGGFGCDELVLYGIRDIGVATLWSPGPMRAMPCWISTNESGPHCNKQFIDGNTNYPKSSPWPENIYLGAWGKIQSEGAKASQEEITDMMPRKRSWLKISEGNIKLGSYTCIFLYLKVENIIKKLMYCFFF